MRRLIELLQRVVTFQLKQVVLKMRTPIEKKYADLAFDAAQCIGCAACVASCPNASASLFVSAKVSHLALLPQGSAQRKRVVDMVDQMDKEGFGGCSMRTSVRQHVQRALKLKILLE